MAKTHRPVRSKRARHRADRLSRRLRVEFLEDRRLLAAGGDEQLTGLGGFESAVASDPNNPDIVAVAQFRTVNISTDGGRTFPTSVTVTPPAPYGSGGGDPTLSFDNDGNLFFGYLARNPAPATPNVDLALFAAQIDVTTGTVVQNSTVALETATVQHDKEWIAADAWEGSPYRNNVYLVWSRLGGGSAILFSRSTDGGATWSTPIQLNGGGQGFVWPSEVTVAPNGDVWVAWHTNTANNSGNLGEIRMRVSSDGGQTFGPELIPFPAGTADITNNVPPNPLMPGLRAWMQGSVQPRILIDPVRPGNVYVVTVDDPDDDYGSGDPSDIVFAKSTDYGATWTRSTISHAPFGTAQVMPSAYIDENGNMAVMWYDNRNGAPSVGVDQIPGTADDGLLLDVFATVSLDGGETWSNDFQINENPFDPDLGPPNDRFPPNNVFRIGEYNGHHADSDLAYVAWTANSGNNQDIAFDVFSMKSAFNDRFESNNTISTATSLGAPEFLTLNDLTIDPGDTEPDRDFFRVSAYRTGMLEVEIHFTDRAGDLTLEIQDEDGNVIKSSASSTDDERVVIGAVAGQDYYIVVSGENGNTNTYDLVVRNIPVPQPSGVVLSPSSDSGESNRDGITNVSSPQMYILVDLRDFADNGIPLNLGPGERVKVFLDATIVGTGSTQTFGASQLGTSSLWTVTPNLVEREYVLTAYARVFDGRSVPVSGDGPLAEPVSLVIDVTAPIGSIPDLLASSDSGYSDTDNVTNIRTPAFSGTGEPNARVRVYADGELVGEGRVGADGKWEVTVEPLDDGLYDITADYTDVAGNTSAPTAALQIEIDTVEPNTPWLDLLAADDTGRHDDDDITNNNTPRVNVFAEDPEGPDGRLFPEPVRFRIYDRTGSAPETLIVDQTAFVANGTYTRQLFADGIAAALADGRHSLKLEVEDRAGNLSHDFLLEIVVDTEAPPVPTLAIDPATSDTGVAGHPDTLIDRITSDTTTGFAGQAEADAIVRLYADGVFDGLTVAEPLDGNAAFDTGVWRQAGLVDLNDPTYFPLDGVRNMTATAEDVAGNVSQAASLRVMIDTQGPRISGVSIPGAPAYNLFGLKPDNNVPTPLVTSLRVSVRDLPNRTNVEPGFLNYPALVESIAENPGHYRLVGDHNGVIDIQSVVFNAGTPVDGNPATGTITLNFARPLPDDRFTLTISDALTDPAGNRLDGESNAAEPQANPAFPSGDGQTGGVFVARFTVDTRAELGTWAAGSVYVDTNGNNVFDPEGKDGDDTNEDITYVLGFTSDDIFAGNFAQPGGTANGFDKLAAYGRVGGAWRWLVDTDDDGVPDIVTTDNTGANGLPVAGNFDGNAANGDEVGVYTGSTWYFDTNQDYLLDTALPSNLIGYPVVGDFDGDNVDDLGTWTDDTFMLDLSQADGVIDGQVDVTFEFGFIGVREMPVAADMDGDGIDDLGLWVPDRSGAAPSETAEWYFLVSGGHSIENRLVPKPLGAGFVVDFTPIPFGNDIFAQFGDDYALPVVGNFDPPVEPREATVYEYLSFQNPRDPVDVNGDGRHTPLDALFIIDALSGEGARALPLIRTQMQFSDAPFLDVTGDLMLTPADVLQVVNALVDDSARGEGEGALAWAWARPGEGESIGLVAPSRSLDGADTVLAADPLASAPASDFSLRIGEASETDPSYEETVDRVLEKDSFWAVWDNEDEDA